MSTTPPEANDWPGDHPPPAPPRLDASDLTTGIPPLDELVDGVRVGDNLVVVANDDVSSLVAQSFLDVATAARVVVVATRPETTAMAPRDAVVLDYQEDESTVEELVQDLTLADAQVGRGAAFLIDSLTTVQRRWGAEAALELFLRVCPRLYGRGSVAMWLLEEGAHDQAFLARLYEITQVVVSITGVDGGLEAELAVAAGRSPAMPGRRLPLKVEDGQLRAAGPIRRGHERLGDLVRRQRLERGLSQSELARRVGISPSAVSQVERGVRGIGGETLMRIWDALGVPFGPDDTLQQGYRIGRRGAHRSDELADGVTGLLLADDATIGQCWRVTLPAGARGDRPLFAGRVREAVLIESGILEVSIGGRHELLHEGDSLVVPRASIDAWGNPGPVTATATWWVLT